MTAGYIPARLGAHSCTHKHIQGLKYSGTVPDFRRAAFGCGKKSYIYKKKKKERKTRLDIITITFEFMSSSANEMKGAQLSRSQNNIISQSEVYWGGSWENVLQTPTFLYLSAYAE